MPEVFLTRQPLVNRQSKIIATRLRLNFSAGGEPMPEAVAVLTGLADVWPQGQKSVFVSSGAPLGPELLDWTIPDNVILEIHPHALTTGDGALLAALKTRQPSLCLDFGEDAAQALSSGTQFRFIGFDVGTYTPAQMKTLVAKTQQFGIPVAFNADTPQEYQAAMEAGVAAASGWFFKNMTAPAGKALNPSHAHIVRVLNLVRNNEDVGKIEAALKQDVALSYKLLRYINSVGFGLSCEIQSFKHAVTILGYDKLNKWLSLLLVTASKDPMAPTMMHTALTRARLMETLGHGLVDKSEYDNLFITGAFSLLDHMLGVSMEQVLEAMHLPEPITDALLGQGGMYAPFYELALACEASDGDALAEQAAMLGLQAAQVNRAQLEALAFADKME
ncbi:MAG: HDOD domain-containing protein [Betaproteobacteria bacterium]|nr:HDOD domain-containing protein [Betaproteobacteria bacterium]